MEERKISVSSLGTTTHIIEQEGAVPVCSVDGYLYKAMANPNGSDKKGKTISAPEYTEEQKQFINGMLDPESAKLAIDNPGWFYAYSKSASNPQIAFEQYFHNINGKMAYHCKTFMASALEGDPTLTHSNLVFVAVTQKGSEPFKMEGVHFFLKDKSIGEPSRSDFEAAEPNFDLNVVKQQVDYLRGINIDVSKAEEVFSTDFGAL